MAAFGVNTAIVSIVLSVFMAGLALGSWGAGVWLRRPGRHPAAGLRAYAGAELWIGALGLDRARRSRHGRPLARVSRRAVGLRAPILLLPAPGWSSSCLPFCVAMGATIPLAMRAAEQAGRSGTRLTVASSLQLSLRRQRRRRGTGTLLSAFVPDRALRLRRHAPLAAGLNFLVAAIAAALGARPTARREAPSDSATDRPESSARFPAHPPRPVLHRSGEHGRRDRLGAAVHTVSRNSGLRLRRAAGGLSRGDVLRQLSLSHARLRRLCRSGRSGSGSLCRSWPFFLSRPPTPGWPSASVDRSPAFSAATPWRACSSASFRSAPPPVSSPRCSSTATPVDTRAPPASPTPSTCSAVFSAHCSPVSCFSRRSARTGRLHCSPCRLSPVVWHSIADGCRRRSRQPSPWWPPGRRAASSPPSPGRRYGATRRRPSPPPARGCRSDCWSTASA